MDLSTLDPAALINSVAHETRFAIECAAEFNARWRAALRERFEAQGAGGELDAWLATGLSNGRPLKLEVMAIKPNVWFSVERISAPSPRDSLRTGLVQGPRAPEPRVRADARRRPVREQRRIPSTPSTRTVFTPSTRRDAGTRRGSAATRRRSPPATRAPTCGHH